jgi:hypothetical protein
VSALLVLLSVGLFALVAGIAVKKQNLIQATPSLVWFALITLPLIFEWSYFPPNPRAAQSVGIFFIALALATGDLVALKIKSSELPRGSDSFFSNNRLIYFLSALVVLIPIINFWLSGSVPILDQYFGGFNPSQVSLDRENFVKLLEVPYLLKVLFHWVSALFGPICVLGFYLKKRPVIASFLLIWVVFYSLSSSADGPILIFCWVTLFATVYALSNFKTLGNYLTSGIAVALIAVVGSGVWLGTTAIDRQNECGVRAQSGFTPGDVMRSCPTEREIIINPIVNRLGYRLFLTPVEVANHWYDYFDGDPSEKRNVSDIFQRQNSKQASNKVGIWAYTERFPLHYGQSISANGSIDADAYSLGGLPSVFLIALILLFIRIFISFSVPKESIFVRILEGIGLSQLAFLPNSAPLQAMLLPQGLGLILFSLLILRGKGLLAGFKLKIN